MLVDQIARQLPILLFISFDGFRHDYLSPTLTPNMFDISKQATIGHMESMFVTKTFPNHFSMVTGLYEDEHEIVNNKMYDPRLNSTFKPGVSSEVWWNYNGNTVPIWTANEMYGERSGNKKYSASMMYPGATTPYLGMLPTHLQDFDIQRNWTKNIETVIDWLTHSEQPPNFVAMYFDEPDSTAHNHGPWGQATLDAVRRIDSAAGYLLKRLRDVDLAQRTNIIFVSDHGMAEVKNVIYLSDFMNTSVIELHGTSPDWSVFVKVGHRHQKSKIFQELLSISKKAHFRIYKRDDIPPDYHYSKSPRVGDFFILVDEKFDMFKERPKEPKNIPDVWGNHGWKPTNRDMRPLFMAYGPSFKQDYYHSEPFPNIDLFPLMVFLLGLPSGSLPNNGSLARIIDVIDINHFSDSNEVVKRKSFWYNTNPYPTPSSIPTSLNPTVI